MAASYHDKDMVRAPMRPTPSAFFNNLTQSGGYVVYAHKAQPCVFSPVTVTNNVQAAVRRVDTWCDDLIYSVQACQAGSSSYVILGTNTGIQVWDKGCTNLLHKWAFPKDATGSPAGGTSSPAGAAVELYARGVATVPAADGTMLLCFGSSRGDLYAGALRDDGKLDAPVASFVNHAAPITSVGSAHQSSGGKWTRSLGHHVVSGDQEGLITVWEVHSPKAIFVAGTISSGIPVASVVVRQGSIIAARLDGTICVYDLATCKITAEIVSHSRWLTAMDLHPSRDVVATSSEDGSLCVWSLPLRDNGVDRATCLMSTNWMHAMPSGVAFCGPSGNDLAVVALDNEELRVYRRSS